MRYKFEISYSGTSFSGWQRQINAITVQEVIETQLSALFRDVIEVVGCGRTDSGVHASQYFFHADIPEIEELDIQLYVYKLNAMLPSTIAIHNIDQVNSDFHARFDAISRSYTYYIHFKKNPFLIPHSYYCYYKKHLNIDAFQRCADLLMNFDDFQIFSKSHSDVRTFKCKIYESKWTYDSAQDTLVYNIKADRFLRGMIRLIVGCTINVARGKLSLDDVKVALEQGKPLKYNWSVPAHALFLSEVKY